MEIYIYMIYNCDVIIILLRGRYIKLKKLLISLVAVLMLAVGLSSAFGVLVYAFTDVNGAASEYVDIEPFRPPWWDDL